MLKRVYISFGVWWCLWVHFRVFSSVLIQFSVQVLVNHATSTTSNHVGISWDSNQKIEKNKRVWVSSCKRPMGFIMFKRPMGFIMFKRLTVFLNMFPLPAYVPMQNAIFLCVSSGMGSTTGGFRGCWGVVLMVLAGVNLGRQAWPRLLVEDFVRVVKVYGCFRK